MDIPASELTPRKRYWLMTSCIVPRPIAWVSTCSPEGVLNLAPFSYFMGIGSRPAMLAVAIGERGGEPKDTARNCRVTHEFVVNVVTRGLAHKMNQTAADYPADVDEFTAAGLTPVPSMVIQPPGVAESPVRLECRVHDVLTPGSNPTHLVIGEIVHFHLDDAVVRDGLADPGLLDPLSRLGQSQYASLGEILEIPRPQI